MDIKYQVGERIKHFRNKKGFSQEKLALMSDISTSFLGHIERGLKSPTVTTLGKISNALNIPIHEFFMFNQKDKSEESAELIERISYNLRDIPANELSHISNIIDEILKIKSK